MTVKYREYRSKSTKQVVGHEIEIRFEWPDGTSFRKRLRAPVSTKSQAIAWGKAREVEIIAGGKDGPLARSKRDDHPEPKEVPTLDEFKTRYLAHARAEKNKASQVDTKEKIFENHLGPHLGKKKLDEIGIEDVQCLKSALGEHSPKTVNNILIVLGHVFSVALEWGIIDKKPKIKKLKYEPPPVSFYDFADYARLVDVAKVVDARMHVVALLGGQAGLRRGEMLALRWSDIDTKRKQIAIARNVWKGVEGTTKGNRVRYVPLTAALTAALQAHRHLRGAYVLCREDGERMTESELGHLMMQATKRAGLVETNGLHILRHTFCSHLAMRGAPVKAIQELAGHTDLKQTMRYMHLSPSATRSAIALLDARGEGLEKQVAALN